MVRGTHTDGKKILQRRHALGLTQEQLGDLASCDVKTVRKAERGENLDYHSLEKLAAALGLAFSDIASVELQARIMNRQLVESWYVAFHDQDLGALLRLLHEDVGFHGPRPREIPFGGEHRGRKKLERILESSFAALIVEPISSDSYPWCAEGNYYLRHSKAAVTVRQSGIKTTLWLSLALRIERARIKDMHMNFDSLTIYRALQERAG